MTLPSFSFNALLSGETGPVIAARFKILGGKTLLTDEAKTVENGVNNVILVHTSVTDQSWIFSISIYYSRLKSKVNQNQRAGARCQKWNRYLQRLHMYVSLDVSPRCKPSEIKMHQMHQIRFRASVDQLTELHNVLATHHTILLKRPDFLVEMKLFCRF